MKGKEYAGLDRVEDQQSIENKQHDQGFDSRINSSRSRRWQSQFVWRFAFIYIFWVNKTFPEERPPTYLIMQLVPMAWYFNCEYFLQQTLKACKRWYQIYPITRIYIWCILCKKLTCWNRKGEWEMFHFVGKNCFDDTFSMKRKKEEEQR